MPTKKQNKQDFDIKIHDIKLENLKNKIKDYILSKDYKTGYTRTFLNSARYAIEVICSEWVAKHNIDDVKPQETVKKSAEDSENYINFFEVMKDENIKDLQGALVAMQNELDGAIIKLQNDTNPENYLKYKDEE